MAAADHPYGGFAVGELQHDRGGEELRVFHDGGVHDQPPVQPRRHPCEVLLVQYGFAEGAQQRGDRGDRFQPVSLHVGHQGPYAAGPFAHVEYRSPPTSVPRCAARYSPAHRTRPTAAGSGGSTASWAASATVRTVTSCWSRRVRTQAMTALSTTTTTTASRSGVSTSQIRRPYGRVSATRVRQPSTATLTGP